MTDDMPGPLDRAHAAMMAAPDDIAARLRFYGRLADSEMLVLLEAEPAAGPGGGAPTLAPRVFDLEDGPVVLIFDSDERLADFAGAAVPYAALPGRAIAAMLAGQGVGLGVNLGVAPSSILLGAEAVEWLARQLDAVPEEARVRARLLERPEAADPALLRTLGTALSQVSAAMGAAHLVTACHDDGSRQPMLVLTDVAPRDRPALARMLGEALAFSGHDRRAPDIAFADAGDAAAVAAAGVGLRLELEPARAAAGQAKPPAARAPRAPGSDPTRPPILRTGRK